MKSKIHGLKARRDDFAPAAHAPEDVFESVDPGFNPWAKVNGYILQPISGVCLVFSQCGDESSPVAAKVQVAQPTPVRQE